MNVIFLDIDGCMNSEIFYRERHKTLKNRLYRFKNRIKSRVKWMFNGFKHDYSYKPSTKIDYFSYDYTFKRLLSETDMLKWKWLSKFCNENDYKICISSVWKTHFRDPNDWNRALIALGFNDNIFVGITGNRRTLRGTEIKEWVDTNNVTKYAILDDDSDMLPEQLSTCYFQVDPYFGLTPNHLYRINRYFKNL